MLAKGLGLMKGLVHIYTGDGKGKTTAAVGLGVRACGCGLKVLMVQFLKGSGSGELSSLKKLEPGFSVYRSKQVHKFTWQMDEAEKTAVSARQRELLDYAASQISGSVFDLVILDEIMAAISEGMIGTDEVAGLVRNRPEGVELILTGRNAPKQLVDLADYVSEITKVKHPMDKGIPPRKGIEA